MPEPAYPRVELKIVGDWGTANFHTLCGWLLAHMRWRSAPRSRFWVMTGTAGRDSIDAVARGEVDLGITSPLHVPLEWARAGTHFFAGTPYPWLRSIAVFPQIDRLVFAVRAETGLTSFEDIRKRKYPLKLATSCRNGVNIMTWVVQLVLRHHGIDPDDIERWGGRWLEFDPPRECLAQFIRGDADGVCHEGISVPQWHEIVEKVPHRFLPMDEGALAELQQTYGLRPAVLPKGRLGNDRDIPCLDWSDWGMFCREDMSDELAYNITSVLVEERAEFEARFRHLPIERSPLSYPIDPHQMWRGLGAPLHPGAERYYREHGYMP